MAIKNGRYEIRYDPIKNRVYFKMTGFWESPDAVPNYVKDWRETLAGVKRGYTILTDATEMIAPPENVIQQRHVPAQQAVMEAGVSKIAEVVKRGLASLSVQHMGKESGMDVYKREFEDRAEAEKWLDEK